jgi:uncharacterized protein
LASSPKQADAGQAVSENNQRMTRVMTMLADLGLDRKELATGQFQIQPQWSQPPRPTPANWQREIVGYRVSNDLWIRTTRIDLAGKLLGLAHQTQASTRLATCSLPSLIGTTTSSRP